MGFVQSVESLPPPFNWWGILGCAVYAHLVLSLLGAGFLSLGTRTPMIPVDRRPMFETSKTGGGILVKKDSFTIPKKSGIKGVTSSRNRRRK